MADNINKIIAKTFEAMADGLETGSFLNRPKIALTGLGSEHGENVTMAGATQAAAKGIDVIYIGKAENPSVKTINAEDEAAAHGIMENILDNKEADAVVTMHYPFPIGVSTVGRVITPGKGNIMYVATTTGTSSADRVEGMILNAIYGIIAAKACGIANPTVGILNIDGANKVESALKELLANSYDINFAQSSRSDGGCLMRGNDVLSGSCDVLVTDSLTGNVLIKMLSAYTTGGNYESVGYGYGPGIGRNYDKLVMIVSRASGASVIAGAIEYAAELVKGNYISVVAKEFAAAEKAGLEAVINKYKPQVKTVQEVTAPPKEIVTAQISGVDVMDLENAVTSLWAKGIYAESGMGCTGPIILVNAAKEQEAISVLKADNWI